MNFELLREKMVEEQVIKRGIKDPAVIEAMRQVPRHGFVPSDIQANAYDDGPLPIGDGQTISQPLMVALMTQALELDQTKTVLEIGTGSGYQTAILAQISKKVYTVERLPELAQRAQDILSQLHYKNISFAVGDGTLGWITESLHFDGIIVTAASDKTPQALLSQLSVGGRLVIPVGRRERQTLTLYIKTENQIKKEELCQCVFVPLIGEG